MEGGSKSAYTRAGLSKMSDFFDKDLFSRLREEIKEHFSNSRGSHDWDHTERVYNLCMHIGRVEKADLEILRLGALLHDIGREEQDRSRGVVCHAEKGAEQSRNLLERYGISRDKVSKVIHCIERHRFRGRKKPVSLEARILYDADKLDSIGAVGVGRAFLFAGEVGARLHRKNITEHNSEPYSRDDTAFREFRVKLRKIKDSMLTDEGKKIAQERHRFMTEFFTRLNKEVDGTL